MLRLITALLLFSLMAGVFPGKAYAIPMLFQTKERVSRNLKPFPKWTGALERYAGDIKPEDTACESTTLNRCHLKEWKKFLKSIENESFMTQLNQINRRMNEADYILDIVNWGVPDYWATPKQFFIKDGDCEDYAIAKYMSLKNLGFPSDNMRIVVLQDQNLDVIHAVLAVYVDDKIYILDNQIKQAVPDEKILHYKPVYSINESHWWRHY